MGVSKKLDKTRNLARSWKSCGRLPFVPRRHRRTDGRSRVSEEVEVWRAQRHPRP